VFYSIYEISYSGVVLCWWVTWICRYDCDGTGKFSVYADLQLAFLVTVISRNFMLLFCSCSKENSNVGLMLLISSRVLFILQTFLLYVMRITSVYPN